MCVCVSGWMGGCGCGHICMCGCTCTVYSAVEVAFDEISFVIYIHIIIDLNPQHDLPLNFIISMHVYSY